MSIRIEINGPEEQLQGDGKLKGTSTPGLIMVEPDTRKKRVIPGAHREWELRARYGTAESDRWTLIGSPIPAQNNPAAAYEDGQYSSLEMARQAQIVAERVDDGTHLED